MPAPGVLYQVYYVHNSIRKQQITTYFLYIKSTRIISTTNTQTQVITLPTGNVRTIIRLIAW